ncbi:hypothetical protein D3C85_904000 [compost metagenome]
MRHELDIIPVIRVVAGLGLALRRLAIFLPALVLAGCVTTPAIVAGGVDQRDACSDGIVALWFNDDAATLRPSVASGLTWPTRATAECRRVKLKVIGLPPPSDGNLQGRRARAIVEVLRIFGAPEPSFELGDAEDQERPVLEVLARP